MGAESLTPAERRERIWRVVEAIPSGCVASYGQIADLAGLPGRARLVGRVLGLVPDDRPLPWQRVLRSSGQLAFAPGTERFHHQRDLLMQEDVLVLRGRVDLERFGWQPDLDELLWSDWAT